MTGNPPSTTDALVALAHDWDRAMVENNVAEIGRYMADEWVIIGSDGRVIDKATFLAVVESGDLVHDVMESTDIEVRVYGEVALLLGRAVSGGRFRGHPFREYERQSNVFVRHEDTWRCVFTHLSRLADAPPH